ncbi:MAG: peptidoglycan-binding protein [Alphaproteobacteria bacterium]
MRNGWRFLTRGAVLALGTMGLILLMTAAGPVMAEYDEPTAGEPWPAGTGSVIEDMPPLMAKTYLTGIQTELVVHGYDPGAVDGALGPRTRRAIRAYQRDAGLAVDGLATKELLDHLKFALPKVYKAGELLALDRGLVIAVQMELSDRGYYLGKIDGISGPQTQAAAKAFQTDAGLPATGVVDQGLLAELRKAER